MDLYSAFLTSAPFILLGITGGITFGPVPPDGRHRAWRLPKWQLISDLLAVVLVLLGAVLSLLVLGDVLPRSEWIRNAVVSGGVLALFLLLLHAFGEIVRLYIRDRDAASSADAKP